MNNPISLRIALLISQLKISQNAFAKRINVSSARISNITTGRNKPDFEFLSSIVQVFTNVSAQWLLTGAGNIFIDQTKDANGIVVIDKEAAAGYLGGHSDPEFMEGLPVVTVPWLSGKKYRAFEVSGDSMLPTLQIGDIIICERLEKLERLRDEILYVFVTDEGIAIKRGLNRIMDRKQILLKSDNEQYPTYSVEMNQVLEAWTARARLTSHMPGKDTIYHQLFELNKRLENLESKNSLANPG